MPIGYEPYELGIAPVCVCGGTRTRIQVAGVTGLQQVMFRLR